MFGFEHIIHVWISNSNSFPATPRNFTIHIQILELRIHFKFAHACVFLVLSTVDAFKAVPRALELELHLLCALILFCSPEHQLSQPAVRLGHQPF